MDSARGVLWSWLALACLSWSCSGGSSSDLPYDKEAFAPDVGVDATLVWDVPAQVDGLVTDVDATDVISLDAEVGDEDVVACDPAAGAFGCPCQGDEGCLSGWCVHHMGERVCSDLCVDTCPQAWDCVQVGAADPVSLCVSRFSHLCLPCTTNADCESVSGTRDVCVNYGPEQGRFCGGACGQGEGCPEGFACTGALSRDGEPVNQCVVDEGVCGCSQTAIEQALSTPCQRSNEWGACAGERVCGPDGLGVCDAPMPSEEICSNQIDDDCDGVTDPWELCPPCACADGICEPERCDGVDNDCDGLTDAEDALDLLAADPRPCELQAGACAGATKPATACVDGAWLACDDSAYLGSNPAYEAGAELSCDGVDNDCDEATDEDFTLALPDGEEVHALGLACGVGACAGGEVVCREDGEGLTCSTAENASAEVCDQEDNDCDGLTDGADDLVFGDDGQSQPACEIQEGVCAGATRPPSRCVEGAWTACVPEDYAATSASYEEGLEFTCDGLDNDCDGAVDEDFSVTQLDGSVISGAGQPCGAGACVGGQTVCDEQGAGVVCDREAQAAPEACNGIDDDCDGLVDAADDSFGGPASPAPPPCGRQEGVCAGAVTPPERCVAGAWQACVTEDYLAHAPSYQAELELKCDGVDEDCDGSVDEDFVLTLADGASVSGPGVACGVGLCAGGVTICDEAGAGIVCSSAGDANPERCNGLDDDCDGLTDEDFPVGVACGLGACAGGVHECSASGQGTRCSTLASGSDPQASAEVCDGLDNDCDGLVDAQDPDLTQGVDAVLVLCQEQRGICAGALTPPERCVDGAWQACSVEDYLAHAPGYQPQAEQACDGLDEDCDGDVDEDFELTTLDGQVLSEVGVACGVGVCAGGEITCDDEGAALICSSEGEAGPERCDGEDDDCDGLTDEGFSPGEACGQGACAGGVVECTADGEAEVCSTSIGGSTPMEGPEVCDGVDNDCDGLTDAEDDDLTLPDVGGGPVACELQDGVCGGALKPASRCVAGAWEPCAAEDYLAHAADYEDGVEARCDGLDGDCDGETDEDFALEMPDGVIVAGVNEPCGVGACAGGLTACDEAEAAIVCSSGGSVGSELCNEIDDDCDGQTDEGYSIGTPCGIGVCAGGAVECQGTDASGCSTLAGGSNQQLTAELCNGLDDDCDGDTDETGAALCEEQTLCLSVSCEGASGCQYVEKVCPESDFCTDQICNPANGDCELQPVNEGEICEDDGNMCAEHRCVQGTCVQANANQGENCTSDPQTKWDKVCWDGECVARWVQIDGGQCTEDRAKWNRKMYRFRGCSGGLTYADAVAYCQDMVECGESDWKLLKQDDDLHPLINQDPAIWNGDCAALGQKTSIHDDFKYVRGGTERTWVTGSDGSSTTGCATFYDDGISCAVMDQDSVLPWACVAVIAPE